MRNQITVGLICAVFGLLAGGAGSYFALGDAPTRREVEAIVTKEIGGSAYEKDKGALTAALDAIKDRLRSIEDKLDGFNTASHELRGRVMILEDRGKRETAGK